VIVFKQSTINCNKKRFLLFFQAFDGKESHKDQLIGDKKDTCLHYRMKHDKNTRFECNQNGRNLNYHSPFLEPGLH
jgi:hypothetical protein